MYDRSAARQSPTRDRTGVRRHDTGARDINQRSGRRSGRSARGAGRGCAKETAPMPVSAVPIATVALTGWPPAVAPVDVAKLIVEALATTENVRTARIVRNICLLHPGSLF